MKAFILLTAAASLAVAQPHGHSHQHHHEAKRHAHANRVEKRDAPSHTVTKWVPGPTETVYELEGQPISEEDAEEGILEGRYVVTGETYPEMPEMPEDPEPEPEPEPTPTPTPTPEPENENAQGAQFFEEPATPSPAPEEKPKKENKGGNGKGNGNGGGGNPGGQGLDSEFPSGSVDCSTFPSSYGPIPIDYLGMNGWTGIQRTPNYSPGQLISYIETGIMGDDCGPNMFCSYACPVGYQKTQWPSDQGATGQSIGGLYCNDEGKLVLSRPEAKTLCEPGVGGVFIQNDLDEEVATCRTDYPGTESMTIPTVAKPGQKDIPLTNPDSSKYYKWQGSDTTAQNYVNKKGRPADKVCLWDAEEDHDGSGNWAPVNIGVGKSSGPGGITYISIFPNLPTTTAQLDFNIEITGDVDGECSLVDGVYYGGGNPSAGCTVGLRPGKKAVIRYYQ